MWCSTCQQDVPGIASPDGGATARCARCRRELSSTATAELKGTKPATKVLDSGLDLEALNNRTVRQPLIRTNPPPLPRDNWQLERDLRAAERLVRQVGTRRIDPSPNTRHSATSAHATQHNPPAWHLPSTAAASSGEARERNTPKADDKPATRPRRSSLLAWLSLSAGLTTFACGAVLLVWSFVTDRKDLWNLGLPLALVGQAGLVLGLVLQLDGLWQSNRDTSETLENLDGQLGELRHATTLLSTTHSAPAQSFYAHIAEGAGPELLLADLKGQLDLLAMKLSNEAKGRA